jgi:hypothetical protein
MSGAAIRFFILSEGHRASHETVQEHGTLMSGAAIDTHTHTKRLDWIDCSCCKEISNTLPKAR